MDEKKLESAKRYYILALINVLNSLNDDYRSQDSVLKQLRKKYLGEPNFADEEDDVHSAFFLMAARTLLDRSFLEHVWKLGWAGIPVSLRI